MTTKVDPRTLFDAQYATAIYSNPGVTSIVLSNNRIMNSVLAGDKVNVGFFDSLATYCINSDSVSKLHENEVVYNYVKGIHEEKAHEYHQLNKTLVNKTQVQQQNYRADDYDKNASMFYTMFMKYTLLVACVIFILGGLTITGQLGTRACFYISVVTIMIFTTIFCLNIASNGARLKTDWSKYNWGGVNYTNQADMSS